MSDIEVQLDFERENRTGLAEAVFCEGKSLLQLQTICTQLQDNDRPMLFTRLAPGTHDVLAQQLPAGFLDYDPVSATGFHQPYSPRTSGAVAVVTGGSSDVPVAREAERTLSYYGHEPIAIHDVGVAGLWRLTSRLDDLKACRIIIAVAGMDAALPTVLGGLVPAAIIAVPTSVGYGMVREGETALRSLLVSCAPGLTVVNIDNGYGAACAAIRILNQIHPPV